jgi:hypothetical protein
MVLIGFEKRESSLVLRFQSWNIHHPSNSVSSEDLKYSLPLSSFLFPNSR